MNFKAVCAGSLEQDWLFHPSVVVFLHFTAFTRIYAEWKMIFSWKTEKENSAKVFYDGVFTLKEFFYHYHGGNASLLF